MDITPSSHTSRTCLVLQIHHKQSHIVQGAAKAVNPLRWGDDDVLVVIVVVIALAIIIIVFNLVVIALAIIVVFNLLYVGVVAHEQLCDDVAKKSFHSEPP